MKPITFFCLSHLQRWFILRVDVSILWYSCLKTFFFCLWKWKTCLIYSFKFYQRVLMLRKSVFSRLGWTNFKQLIKSRRPKTENQQNWAIEQKDLLIQWENVDQQFLVLKCEILVRFNVCLQEISANRKVVSYFEGKRVKIIQINYAVECKF